MRSARLLLLEAADPLPVPLPVGVAVGDDSAEEAGADADKDAPGVESTAWERSSESTVQSITPR